MEIHHRYFVQYMLQNGVSSVNNAITYCRDVSKGKISNMTQLKTVVREINNEISKQFYKIVFSMCEVTNQEIIVWLNTKNDDISKYQISYSTIELEYFHAILNEIITSEGHRITFMACLNIASTLTAQFSRDNGQKVLNKWIKGGYYVKQGDYIHLGPRTILEFTAYLKSKCPDSICNLCSEIVFTGKKCSNCDKVLHAHCLSTYLSNQNVCPCCHNEWMHASEEGQDDTVDTNDLVNDVNTNGMLSREEQTVSENPSQSGSESPLLSSKKPRRSKRIANFPKHNISDIDKPGPSNKNHH